jgi:hypothetical protein
MASVKRQIVNFEILIERLQNQNSRLAEYLPQLLDIGTPTKMPGRFVRTIWNILRLLMRF